jgi:hypothetical protein
MSNPAAALSDAQELARRRTLLSARQNREAERTSLLAKLIETERKATELREWVALQESRGSTRSPEMQRLLDWAKANLSDMEQFLVPAELTQLLRAQNLFPQVDELVDPLGDPPPFRPWGR